MNDKKVKIDCTEVNKDLTFNELLSVLAKMENANARLKKATETLTRKVDKQKALLHPSKPNNGVS